MHGVQRMAILMAGYPFVNAEAAALVARMTVQPTDARKALIDTLVGALKTAGTWAKRDCLYILAAHDAQAARLNWIQNSNNLSAVSSPTFTIDRGYTGDGASAYLDSAYTMTSGQYAQNDASMFVWTGTSATTSNIYDIGTTTSRINAQATATSVQACANNAVVAPAVVAGAFVGMTTVSRKNSANFDTYRNAVTLANTVIASSVTSLPAYILARAGAGPSAAGFTTRRAQAGGWGAGLSASEVLAEYTAIAAHMTAIGA